MQVRKNNNRVVKSILCAFAIFSLGFTGVQAQVVDVKITLSTKLTEAEELNLGQLGVSASSGSTSEALFWLEIINRTQVEQKNLKLVVEVSSTREGLLLRLEQSDPGFNLDAGQRVFAASNVLTNGLPGVEEAIKFDGNFDDKLTDSGRDFYNQTGGNLPNDLYTVNLSIKQGFQTLATSTEYLGVKPIQTAVDFFLIQPGSDVGSSATIMTSNPNFRWDGPRNAEYRLLVVKKEKNIDDSPESLIQAAFSTSPTIDKGMSNNATLLDFEIVDAIILGNDFTLPPQGVQKIEDGKQYYWQIYFKATTDNGFEYKPSTIWEFKTLSPGDNAASSEALNQMYEKLANIVSSDLISELQQAGFKLVSIEHDKKTVNGPLLIQTIEQIKRKFESGEYKF